MTKVAVVVSRRFFQKNGFWYTVGASGPETGAHYLDVFDEVILCGREGQVPEGDVGAVTALDSRIRVVLLPNVASPLGQLLLIRRLRAILREVFSQVDAVIVRLGQNSFCAAALARRMGKPLACDVGGRSFDSVTAFGSWVGQLYAPLSEWRARRAVQRCDYVSFVTAAYLQSCYPVRHDAVTFAGSNVDIATPGRAVLERRLARIVAQRETLVFGTIGSLAGRLKGIHIALEALAQRLGSLPPWHYRVLGGGDPSWLRERAAALGISHRVSFDGTRPSGDPVLEWLDEIDVLLHPSLREGVPRAVIEAMSRGCPVIATSVAGTPELLEQDDLIPAGSVCALTEALPATVSLEWQANRARRNWEASHRYARETMGARRKAFWQDFARFARDRA